MTYHQRADREFQKREQLAEKLRELSPEQLTALGINPELLRELLILMPNASIS